MKTIGLLALCCATLIVAGCSQQPAATEPASSAPSAAVDGSVYLMAAEPEGAAGVIQVRQAAQDQDDVVIVGRIGGSENPWIDGRAAFSIVDPSLKSCAEIGSDQCPKPWDYC